MVQRLERAGRRAWRRRCRWSGRLGGGAPDGRGARGIPADRRHPNARAERLFLVFHLDRAALVLPAIPRLANHMAAAHRARIPLLQRADRLPSDRALAIRSVSRMAYLRTVLRAAGVAGVAGNGALAGRAMKRPEQHAGPARA